MADRRKEKRTSRLSVVISLIFHGVIIGGLVFVAAREGILGKELKKIAVTMVPKEKPPEEKPKEKPPEEKPPVEEPKPELPKPVENIPQIAKADNTPPPAATSVAPSAAPAPVVLSDFDFEGGKVVPIGNSAAHMYQGYVEYTLRSRWNRPEGIADENYVAEVELAVDSEGRVLGTQWKKGSGDAAWDNSVRQALAGLSSIGRPPPKDFPDKVLVRFDVQPVEELGMP